MYSVYILYSLSRDFFYVGITKNIDRRLYYHHNSKSGFTNRGRPWLLIWFTKKKSKREAESLERKLKNLSRIRKIKFMKKNLKGIQDQSLLDFIEI